MTTNITIPEKASIAEYKAILADARAQEAGIETIFAILDMIAAKEARIDLIAKTENFKPTQAKLFVRRSSDETILSVVPDTDVFDDIAVQDIKRDATGNKRIVTTDEQLAAYQALKADGVTDIIYDKDNDCIVANPVEANAPTPTVPTVPTEEDNTTNETNENDNPEAVDPGEG